MSETSEPPNTEDHPLQAEPSPEIAPPPATAAVPTVKKKRCRKNGVMLLAYGLALIAAVASTGYFGYRLFQGPQEKPVMTVAPRPVAPASSTIIATTAAPEPPKPQLQTTLAQIAKVEAVKRSTAGGPLYDTRSRDVALSYDSLKQDDPQVVEALALLAKYEKAASWRDRLAFIYQPERCQPLMQQQYEVRQQQDPDHGNLAAAGLITAGPSKVLNLVFTCPTRPDSGMRANFHRTQSGQLLLDWESWAAWSDKPWAEFKKERSQIEVVMRAMASESDYYNYEFSESWRWLAVKLRSPDGLHSVTGYVERSTGLGIALANLIGVPLPNNLPKGAPLPALKLPGSKAPVTVRLAFPQKAESDNCVRIINLLADRWLLFPGEEK